MDKDHSYGVSSSQNPEVFNQEWNMMADGDYSTYNQNDQTLAQLNLDSSLDQDACSSSSGNVYLNDIIQVDPNNCEELLNTLLANNSITLDPVNLEMTLSGTTNVLQGLSSLPASENWPGDYGFNISFSCKGKKKGVTWAYVEEKDKLYVGKETPCPINFSTSYPMPEGVKIRAMALYSSPDSVSEVVERCHNHAKEDRTKNILEADHLVRCECPAAQYEKDAITNRYSVVVPFENPPAGQAYSTYIYKFACFGSCPGPNRRPLMLVFSLERNNQVIGRRKIDVKICACPGRDSKTEGQHSMPVENISSSKKRKIKKEPESSSASDTFSGMPSHRPKKLKQGNEPQTDESTVYQINVKDKGCYKFLKSMKTYYEIMKTMESLPPEIKKVLEDHQKRKGINLI